MEKAHKLFAGLALLASLLTGCGSGGGSSNSNSSKKEDTFTVTWENFDGSILKIDEKVPAGTKLSYDGVTPTRASTSNYSYSFSGWSPTIQPVIADTIYIAQYDSTLTASYVSFDLNGGKTNSDFKDRYITSIQAENFFFDVTKEGYKFRGWECSGRKIFDEKGKIINDVEVAERMTFKALFSDTLYLTVSANFKDAGVISGAGEYKCKDNVTLSVTVNEGYKFIGWFNEDGTLLSNQTSYLFTMWNEDIAIIAKFDKVL